MSYSPKVENLISRVGANKSGGEELENFLKKISGVRGRGGRGRLLETPKSIYVRYVRARSLVVSDLRSVTKGSRFESGCQLCAEVSSLQ